MKYQSLLCCIFLAGLTAHAQAQPNYQGIALLGAAGFDAELLDESILDIRQVGANTVAVDLNWSQPSLTATPRLDTLDMVIEQVAPVIDAIHNRGLDVFLRSNVVVDSGEFSGRITPAQTSTWFSDYGEIMDRVSTLAGEKNIAMLSVGSNLNQLEANEFVGDWQQLIGNVRSKFNGTVTYSADVADNVGGGFRDLSWWNEVDVIGVNAFLPLSFDFNAIPEALVEGAVGWVDDFELWYQDSDLNQKIVFTDIGYRSQDGGAVFPLERAGDRVDLDEQAHAYEAIQSTFESRDWWDGAFWTGWQADPHVGGPGDADFSPQGKPAEAVLANFYGGQANAITRPSLLESWENGFDGWRIPDAIGTGGLRLDDALGITHGETSLSLPSSSSSFSAAKVWSLSGSEAYTLLQEAALQPEKFNIEFDVTIDFDQVAVGSSTIVLLSLEDDSEQPVVVNLPVSSGTGIQTERLSVSLAEFGELNRDAIFYELQLGTNNSWDGRVFIDDLRLSSSVPGDVTNDTIVDCGDIDSISHAIRHGWTERQYDVNFDGEVNEDDRIAWTEIRGTLLGDADLNGKVEFADFLIFSDNFAKPGNWCDGDVNGDREINFADFLLLSDNFGGSAAGTLPAGSGITSVPEPTSRLMLLASFVLLLFRKSR